MFEDEHLEADYEDRYQNDDSYDDVLDAIEDDALLERQEMEDFEQANEWFGYYGDCDVD